MKFTPYNITIRSSISSEPWITNPDSNNFLAARKSIKRSALYFIVLSHNVLIIRL
jgi:hypothetical protein